MITPILTGSAARALANKPIPNETKVAMLQVFDCFLTCFSLTAFVGNHLTSCVSRVEQDLLSSTLGVASASARCTHRDVSGEVRQEARRRSPGCCQFGNSLYRNLQ